MSFAALMLRARAANDTMRAQVNNIPSKSHVIPLFIVFNYYPKEVFVDFFYDIVQLRNFILHPSMVKQSE